MIALALMSVLATFGLGIFFGWQIHDARKIRALRQQVWELQRMLTDARRDLLPLQQRLVALERQIDNQPFRHDPDAANFDADGPEAEAFRKLLVEK